MMFSTTNLNYWAWLGQYKGIIKKTSNTTVSHLEATADGDVFPLNVYDESWMSDSSSVK